MSTSNPTCWGSLSGLWKLLPSKEVWTCPVAAWNEQTIHRIHQNTLGFSHHQSWVWGMQALDVHTCPKPDGNAHDCAWCMRDSTTKWCHNEAHDANPHYSSRAIRVPRQSETSSHCVKEGSADVSRSTWWAFCSKHGHVTRTSCDRLPAKS